MQLMNYFRSVIKEVKNITFPKKEDVKLTSFIILIIIGLSMVIIGCTDFLISKLIKILLGMF